MVHPWTASRRPGDAEWTAAHVDDRRTGPDGRHGRDTGPVDRHHGGSAHCVARRPDGDGEHRCQPRGSAGSRDRGRVGSRIFNTCDRRKPAGGAVVVRCSQGAQQWSEMRKRIQYALPVLVVVCVAGAASPAAAQTFTSGSSGIHGVFPPAPVAFNPSGPTYIVWNMETGLVRYCSVYDAATQA